MAIPRHCPALEARRTEPSEVTYAALDEWLDLEVFLPERPIPQMLRQTSEEEIGRLNDVPVGRDDKVLFGHSMRPSCAGLARAGEPKRSTPIGLDGPALRFVARLDQPVGTKHRREAAQQNKGEGAVAKRRTQR